jgi:starch synthase
LSILESLAINPNFIITMNVIHLSAECYPVAKVGGLADVVGALPRYQQETGHSAVVVLPYYDRPFVQQHEFELVYQSEIRLGERTLEFQVLKESRDVLGFHLHLIKIPGLIDRPEVYCYPDEIDQFIAFQVAFMEWLRQFSILPDVIHCHDHHTGLVPFLLNHSARYRHMASIPTVLTIHNAQYQGWMSWDKLRYLPEVDMTKTGLLGWGDSINSLAAAVKCCWKYTAVSPSYLAELTTNSNGLESLFRTEQEKGLGIVNGIDTELWNPVTDEMIPVNYSADNVSKGKAENKKLLCKEFGLSTTKPLLAFIGRLALEKGADLLPGAIRRILTELRGKVNVLVLGSGDSRVEEQLTSLKNDFPRDYNAYIGYDENLSHRIYAGADFLLMPSRVEPCGLNQLYALRYGTIPVVRSTGGLKDTVIDVHEEDGYGIRFESADIAGIFEAAVRALELCSNSPNIRLLRKKMMSLDYSWHQSANQYINLYNSLKS